VSLNNIKGTLLERHSDASHSDNKKKDHVEDKHQAKKRKATDEEEGDSNHKKAKTLVSVSKKEATPKKEIVREEKMETDASLMTISPEEDRPSSDKMDTIQENVPEKPLLPQASIVKAILQIARHPVAKYHKLDIVSHTEGHAMAKAFFSDARPNSKYEVHAVLGAAYFLIDATCYAALLSHMREGDSAITQDIHVNVLAPIPPGSEVIVKAKVLNIKKTGLVILDGELWLGPKLMVTARVLKNLLEPDIPVKEVIKEEIKDKKDGQTD